MKYCPRCGSQTYDDMNVCPKCGGSMSSMNNQYTQGGQQTAQTAMYAPYNQYYQPQQAKDYATGSLVCGIVSFFAFGLILGIIAIVLANKDKAQYRGIMTGAAKAGKICGIVSIVLSALKLLLVILYIVLILAAIGEGAAMAF